MLVLEPLEIGKRLCFTMVRQQRLLRDDCETQVAGLNPAVNFQPQILNPETEASESKPQGLREVCVDLLKAPGLRCHQAVNHVLILPGGNGFRVGRLILQNKDWDRS